MDDKTLQALTALANKLGTTAEYLWSVLVKQAPITGAIDLLVMAAWVFGCVALVKFVLQKTTAPPATEENRFPRADWDDEPAAALAWALTAIAVVVTAIGVGSQLSIAISALLNPEYWALRQILK